MPYKNRIKDFSSDSYYHLYARGINKTEIFRQKSDYSYFLYLLKKYLTPGFKEKRIVNGLETEFEANSVSHMVSLNAYCLMPNHFHLLVYNKEVTGIQFLMRRVLTAYVRVFNRKYSREGTLIQGSYRAVTVYGEPQIIHLSRYIHLNPLKDKLVTSSIDYPYSSLKYYKAKKSLAWLSLNPVISDSSDFNLIDSYLKVFEKEDSPNWDYPN